ncbi:MAG: hypothetical protein RIC87_12590 [Kiloniellales bacterium]
MIEQVFKLCLLGATNAELADFFGVGGSTIDRWLDEEGEFWGAVKRGRSEADANVASRLYERAMGFTHPEEDIRVINGEVVRVQVTKQYPPDTTAAIFWLKNRRPDKWRDKKDVELDAKVQHDTAGPLSDFVAQALGKADEDDETQSVVEQ